MDLAVPGGALLEARTPPHLGRVEQGVSWVEGRESPSQLTQFSLIGPIQASLYQVFHDHRTRTL